MLAVLAVLAVLERVMVLAVSRMFTRKGRTDCRITVSGRYCVRSARNEIAAIFVSANRACRSDVVSSGSSTSKHSCPAYSGSTAMSASASASVVASSAIGVLAAASSCEGSRCLSIFACSAAISSRSAASRGL